MIITNSTRNARLEAKQALDPKSESPIVHLITDDFEQVVAIMDYAFFERDAPEPVEAAFTPGTRSEKYISLRMFLDRCKRNKEKEDPDKAWLELIAGENGKRAVIYMTAGRKGDLDDDLLEHLMDYQEQRSLARCFHKEMLPKSCMVIYGRQVNIPPVLEPHVTRIKPKPLDEEDMLRLLSGLWKPGDKHRKELETMSAWYANELSGFPEKDICRILQNIHYGSRENDSRLRDIRDDSTAKKIIRKEKDAILDAHGKLERIPAKDQGQGLEPVRSWVEEHRANIKRTDFSDEKDITKGILLLGLPGTGKSMMSQSIAARLELPLLKLTMGRILDKYQGESDKNMLQVQEDLDVAGAPCVLWIDEVEKVFSHTGSDNGSAVMTRIFGLMLDFMQQMKRSIFIVATANNISVLPREFLRSGRFSQIFSLMLPTYQECVDIMCAKVEHHLGVKDKLLAEQLVKVCAGLAKVGADGTLNDSREETHVRFFTGSDIDALTHEMCIKMKCLPGSKHYSGSDLRRDARIAMEKAVKQGRFTVDSRIPRTLEQAAASYMTVLEESAQPANSDDPLFSRDTYVPGNVTPETQKDFSDMTLMPLCLDIPGEKYKNLTEYDRRMVRWIGNTMDRLLKQKPQA